MTAQRHKGNAAEGLKALAVIVGTAVLLVLLWLVGTAAENPGFRWTEQQKASGSAGSGGSRSEIPVCEYAKVENRHSRRRYMVVEFSVFVQARADNPQQLADLVDRHRGELTDDIRAVVAGMSPEALRDPQLVSIKREVQDCLEGVVGAGLVGEVLVPVWHCEQVR